MEEKYNILWLDDDFDPSSTAGFKERVEEYEQEQSEFHIQKVTNQADFEKHFNDSTKQWDVVILDVYGKSGSDGAGLTAVPFIEALEVVKDRCQVVVGCSGEHLKPQHHESKDLIQVMADKRGVEIIPKKTPMPSFFEKIRKKIPTPFRRDFPEYRIVEKYLDYDRYGDCYNAIQEIYNKNVRKFSGLKKEDFGELRTFASWIFNTEALEKGYLDQEKVKDDRTGEISFGSCLTELASIANTRHKMSYARAALLSLNKITNVDHHEDLSGKAYDEYGKYRFHMLFNALFICLKWYYEEFVPSFDTVGSTSVEKPASDVISSPDTADGIICLDEERDVLYIGNIQLFKPKGKQIIDWKLDVDFTLKQICPNTSRNKDKYPWFAYCKQLSKK